MKVGALKPYLGMRQRQKEDVANKIYSSSYWLGSHSARVRFNKEPLIFIKARIFVQMQKEAIYDTIKKTVDSCLPGARVLLFGSHARGTNDKHSDYDLLVINPGELSRSERLNYSRLLHDSIIKAIKAPVDLLLYSEEEVAAKKEFSGHIVRFAMKEGIIL